MCDAKEQRRRYTPSKPVITYLSTSNYDPTARRTKIIAFWGSFKITPQRDDHVITTLHAHGTSLMLDMFVHVHNPHITLKQQTLQQFASHTHRRMPDKHGNKCISALHKAS